MDKKKMDKKWKRMMGVLMLSSIIFLGSCEEEGIVKIQKSSKDSNKGPVKISKLVDNLEEASKLPEGGEYEVVGGGYAVAMGEVDGSKKMWLSEEKDPRDWTEIESVKIKNDHSASLAASLQKSFPSRLTKISADGEALKVTDEDGDIWISEDTGVNWGIGKFAGGSGTDADPYQIASATQLWLVRNHLTSHFQLIEDLDLRGVTESEGFKPIGDKTNKFTGTFDGNGKKIQNLTINRQDENYVGLFGGVGNGGVVKDIGLEDVDIKGAKSVGSLVGLNAEGTITNSHVVNGTVVSPIARSYFANVGGLVGKNTGGITNSHATVEVRGIGDHGVGGLVGLNGGNIVRSHATGDVTGDQGVGGLVGSNEANITRSYATGAVRTQGIFRFSLGGLVGESMGGGTITESYATGNVTTNKNKAGGLVGKNNGTTIENSYATGNVQGGTLGRFTGGTDVGGLVGDNTPGVIKNSYATGNVNSFIRVGGLVGSHGNGTWGAKKKESKIENSYATGIVTVASGGKEFGGFVGKKEKARSSSFFGTVVIAGKNYWKTQAGSAKGGIGKGGEGTEENVEGKTDAQLKALTASDTSWDTTIWDFNEGQYPKLKWQSE